MQSFRAVYTKEPLGEFVSQEIQVTSGIFHCTIRQDLQNAKIIKYYKALFNAKLRLYHEKVLYTFCTVANTNVSHDGQGWM